MPPVAIVTDSTHYMPRELREANSIHEVSLYFNWGDGAQRESDLEGYDDFYARLGTGEMPTTSQPSIGDFLAAYEPLIEAGQEIVSIHLSGGISGTFAAATQAAAMLEERGARDQITVLDSQTACGGLAGMVLAAAAVATSGGDRQAVVTRAQEARSALKIWFCIDTLEFLRRGGRIGKAQAWLGGALKVKPILSLEAEITPVERVRTAGRAFERIVDYMRDRRDAGADAWVIQHIRAPEQAERLVAHGREIFASEPLIFSEVGPVLGAYTGPGMIGMGALPAACLVAGQNARRGQAQPTASARRG